MSSEIPVLSVFVARVAAICQASLTLAYYSHPLTLICQLLVQFASQDKITCFNKYTRVIKGNAFYLNIILTMSCSCVVYV